MGREGVNPVDARGRVVAWLPGAGGTSSERQGEREATVDHVGADLHLEEGSRMFLFTHETVVLCPFCGYEG